MDFKERARMWTDVCTSKRVTSINCRLIFRVQSCVIASLNLRPELFSHACNPHGRADQFLGHNTGVQSEYHPSKSLSIDSLDSSSKNIWNWSDWSALFFATSFDMEQARRKCGVPLWISTCSQWDFWGVKREHRVTLAELVGRPINLVQ